MMRLIWPSSLENLLCAYVNSNSAAQGVSHMTQPISGTKRKRKLVLWPYSMSNIQRSVLNTVASEIP